VKRALAAALALALAALPTACKRPEEQPPVGVVVAALPALGADHQPLRARFDGDAATPRLLVLASPT
jgi:hypothetical protein